VTRILAPHKEQQGWRYVRVRWTGSPWTDDQPLQALVTSQWALNNARCIAYNDSAAGSRIISSRRVEEAVEIYDYLKLCAEEGLTARFFRPNVYGWDGGYRWAVGTRFLSGDTLREAYHRYKAANDDTR
jgi:hypothetical protein